MATEGHVCRQCDNEGRDGVLGELVTGQRWSEYHERYVVFRGYLCDMCLEDMKPGYRFVNPAPTAGRR